MTEAADLRWLCPHCGGALDARSDALGCAHCGRSLAVRDGIVEAAPGFVPAGFAPARRDHLETLASGHFWFPPRNRLLSRLVASELPAGGARFARAIELGCGTGPFLAPLARLAVERVGLDAYRESLVAARGRGEGALLVQGDVQAVPLAPGQFDLLLALDVLEHVEPGPFLREAARLGAADARLAVSVPASPRLWSDLDRAAGHRQRSLKEYERLIEQRRTKNAKPDKDEEK